jgi:hypothetical protein
VSLSLELWNQGFVGLWSFYRLRSWENFAMMKTSTVALVCILVMVMVVVEPTIVQGKVEEKSHLEAAKEATSQSIQNAVDKAGKQKKNKDKGQVQEQEACCR